VISGQIRDDVTRDHRGWRNSPSQIPPDLLIQYVASTFILVLNWWLDSRSPLHPREVDELFRSLVLPTVAVD